LYCAPDNGYILHNADGGGGAPRKRAARSITGCGHNPDRRRIRVAIPQLQQESPMAWSAPVVSEICVGMEVTSYESAEIDTFN
jgi:coenzyme PQQ precursor peptide PqqA